MRQGVKCVGPCNRLYGYCMYVVLCMDGACMLVCVICGWHVYVMCCVWVVLVCYIMCRGCACFVYVCMVFVCCVAWTWSAAETHIDNGVNAYLGVCETRGLRTQSPCWGFSELGENSPGPLPLSRPTHWCSHKVCGRSQRGSHLSSSKGHQGQRQWARPA